MSFESWGEKLEANNAVALDCEMVGAGKAGSISILGRVSIVDSNGNVLLDEYVKPTLPVTDYRTRFSGIRPKDLEFGVNFNVVQNAVLNIIEDKLLVGHALYEDIAVLKVKHPKFMTYDTQKCPFVQNYARFRNKPSLKLLARRILNEDVQTGEHDSVEDARATMQIYKKMQKLYREGHFVF